MEYKDFLRLLSRSKEYKFINGTILEIKDYYTGTKVMIDLAEIPEEVFEDIQVEDYELKEW